MKQDIHITKYTHDRNLWQSEKTEHEMLDMLLFMTVVLKDF